jgi:hypothetical protein
MNESKIVHNFFSLYLSESVCYVFSIQGILQYDNNEQVIMDPKIIAKQYLR